MAVPDVREMLRLLDENREDEAIAQLEAALPHEPTSASTCVLLARAYERVGRLAPAMEAWTTALFLAPESATARSGVRRMRKLYPDLNEPPRKHAPSREENESARAANVEHPGSRSGRGEAAVSATTSSRNGDTEEHLDRLIRELEDARIVPDPNFDVDDVAIEDEDDDEGMVSETLARIYAAQQQYREAAQVYEILADQQPARAAEFRQKAQEMKMRGRG